ncbi:LOW QUALITY PROTEIN: protein Niban 1-like [Oncorhynchus masou masou]|uniref:LOW QUALITY PROTEIN: protein Niban 1-like n=1 Tax=Oncorhynchus masou masou TaxID=90313 RepID=UPI003183DAC6
MGASSSSLLDETKSNYIRGRAESELKNFSPHYRQQYFVAFFSQLQEEVEQHKETHTQLLKQREPLRPEEVLYQDSVLHYDDTGKWKERFVVMRANHSLECHDNQESFSKGVPARQRLLPTGGVVLTSEEKYTLLVDKAFPDPKCLKEETSPPMVVVPSGQFPVYLRLPYRRDVYFSFPQEDRRATFLSILTGCIRHQNHDSLRRSSCECQAFLKAIHFYRQEKGHYESWDMLVGCEEQVLANLVLEELQPSLQTELLARLKGKKAGRKRVWFTTLEAAYHLVQDQLREGLKGLKEECKETARSHEALLRSDMDQIASSRTFLQAKLQASVSDPAAKFCSENVSPYLASILEELMSPVTGGFQGVRLLLEGEINALCLGFPEGAGHEGLNQALGQMCQASLEECYQKVEVLTEQLQDLRHRFKFSNSVRLIHCTQIDMQQLMENAMYTFKLLLQSSLKDNPSKLTSAMEKAKLRVLKQYDHDSSTVRKRIFQEALVDITLPAIRRSLAPAHKPDLQKLDQYIFADYTNFIKVENVYEDILLNILTIEVDKVVKEAASLRKNNLMVDSTDLQSASQSSLTDSRTPPLSIPASPAKMAVSGLSRQAERASSPLLQNSSSGAGRLEEEGGPVVPDMAALTPPVIVITPQSETPDPDPLSLPAPAHILTYTVDVSVVEPDTPSPRPEMSSAERDYPSGAASTKPDASLVNHDAPLATITPYAPAPQPPLPVAEPAPQTPEVTDTAKASQPPGTEDKPDTAKASQPPGTEDNPDTAKASQPPGTEDKPDTAKASQPPGTEDKPDTAKASQPPGTEDKPDTAKASQPPGTEDKPDTAKASQPPGTEDKPDTAKASQPPGTEDKPDTAKASQPPGTEDKPDTAKASQPPGTEDKPDIAKASQPPGTEDKPDTAKASQPPGTEDKPDTAKASQPPGTEDKPDTAKASQPPGTEDKPDTAKASQPPGTEDKPDTAKASQPPGTEDKPDTAKASQPPGTEDKPDTAKASQPPGTEDKPDTAKASQPPGTEDKPDTAKASQPPGTEDKPDTAKASQPPGTEDKPDTAKASQPPGTEDKPDTDKASQPPGTEDKPDTAKASQPPGTEDKPDTAKASQPPGTEDKPDTAKASQPPGTEDKPDTAKASQPPGTEDKPDTDKARNSPVSDSVSVCVEALSAVSMILPEATVLSTGQRQRQATDRAVYLKTPAGVKEGASVPLTVDEKEEEEEHLCKEAEAHHIGTAPSNAHIETVDSDLVHSDTPPEMKASGTVQTSSSTQARDTEPACQTQNDPNPTGSEMQPGGNEDRAAVTSVTRVTVTESEGTLLACNTLVTSRGGATTPLTGPEEGVVEAGDRREALGGVVEAGDRREALGGVVEAGDRREALGGVVEAGDRREVVGGVVEAGDRREALGGVVEAGDRREVLGVVEAGDRREVLRGVVEAGDRREVLGGVVEAGDRREVLGGVVEAGDRGEALGGVVEALGLQSNTVGMEGEEEAVPLGSVQSIRDLVMEVVEVEELIQRCPPENSTP